MEKEKTSPEQAGVETAVQDFIRFLPEEKRNDYELMLRRCNFHEPTEPMFPIMLFLLFFQESVSENVDRIEESIGEMKSVLSERGKARNPRMFLFLLIALTIVNLVLFCCGVFHRNSPLVESAAKAAPASPHSELQQIHRYWTRKLTEKPENRQSGPLNEKLFAVIAVAGAVSAWIPVIFILLQKYRPFGERQDGHDSLMRTMFRRLRRHKKQPSHAE